MPQCLILGSGSRFRRQMLLNAGLTFEVVTAAVDEPAARATMERETPGIAPDAVALKLAALKALDVSARHPDALVVGSDQVLALDKKIYSKPANTNAARAQLRELAGRTHTLPTGVALAERGQIVWTHLGVPTLAMRAFSDAFLDDYLAQAGDSVTETVGGYALEGLGAQLFDTIDGDYFTIIGLPLLPLLAELRRRNVLMT